MNAQKQKRTKKHKGLLADLIEDYEKAGKPKYGVRRRPGVRWDSLLALAHSGHLKTHMHNGIITYTPTGKEYN